jgi:hypothetical protein
MGGTRSGPGLYNMQSRQNEFKYIFSPTTNCAYSIVLYKGTLQWVLDECEH